MEEFIGGKERQTLSLHFSFPLPFLPRNGSTGVALLERLLISFICFLRRRTCLLITTLLFLPLTHGSQSQVRKGQSRLCPLRLDRIPWFLQRVQEGLRSLLKLIFTRFSWEDSSILLSWYLYKGFNDDAFYANLDGKTSKGNKAAPKPIVGTCQSNQTIRWWLDKLVCSRAQHVLNRQAWKCFVHFFLQVYHFSLFI